MRFKTGMLIGFGAGYVLGAKAGRERYQQIVEATRAFLDNPGVQRLTDEVGKTVNIGKERVTTATSRRMEQVGSTLADQAGKARSFVSGGEDQAGGAKEKETASTSAKSTEDKAKSGAATTSASQSTRSGRPG